jgi:6-pyruvoyl-tetrahydropterin synthase
VKTTVARRYTLRARHHLPDLAAPWNEPHDHDYTIEIAAERDGHHAYVIDTDLIDAWFDEDVRPQMDGQNLNETLPVTTTVEAIADWILQRTPRDARITAVTVWEDQDRWGRADYR